jgi:hypothetical protein
MGHNIKPRSQTGDQVQDIFYHAKENLQFPGSKCTDAHYKTKSRNAFNSNNTIFKTEEGHPMAVLTV